MKLSEAIREGAKKRPQAYGALFEYNENGELCSCVLGSAMEALGAEPTLNHVLGAVIPILEKETGAPMYSVEFDENETHELHEVMTHLNDVEGSTREQIADWLESEGL